MNRIIFSGLLLLSAALPAFAQEQAPVLDTGFGIKPFSMGDDFWIIDARPSADGGTYLAGAWHNLTKLDAAGNKLWSASYTADGSYVDMPGNIAVDGADNVYVGIYDYPQGRIQKYSPGGNLLQSYAVDDVLFGVAFNKTQNRLYAVTGAGTVLMLDDNLNLLGSAAYGDPAASVWAEGGIGLDTAGNVYISGWSAIGTTRRLIGLKYTAALTPLWEYSEPIGSNPFTAGEVIPEGGMYLIREYRNSDPKLLKISGDGVKLWETVVPEDYHYYKGVDKAGNFYGATWAQEYDWLPVITKYGYEDGIVQWTMPETHSGEIDDIYFDAQAKLYTVGYLMEPVGDAENYISRYAGGDTEAPAAVLDLAVTAVSSDTITLAWTAPGDDGIIGTASSYDLRYTTMGAIVSAMEFSAATQAQGEPMPQTAGGAETFTITGLAPGTTYFFGVKTTDEAGNMGGLSNSPRGITAAVPVEKYEIYGSTVPTIVVVNTYSSLLVSSANVFGTTNPASGIRVGFTISTFPIGAIGQSLTKSSETIINGRADVQLKLGNIPAEYGVTATCTSCEASASSFTFTCCGKLPNDDFKQFDVRWSTAAYDNICSIEPANTGDYRPVYTCGAPIFNNPQYQKYKFTIQAKGCALSALAALINHYRDAYSLPISSAIPAILNTYLNENSGYDKGGSVFFNKVANWSNNRIVYVQPKIDMGQLVNGARTTRNDLMRLVKTEVMAKRPVIVRISSGHFLLVVGLCGDDYIVSDPGSAWRYRYNPIGALKLIGVRRFKKL